MAKNKKPKFLEKETPDLLALLKETLAGEEADTKKALKITEELISRLPQDEGPMSVDEALKAAADQMTTALNDIKEAYNNEVSMMEDSEEDEAEDEAEEEEETPKAKKSKKAKKAKKEEPEENEDDSDGEDDSDEEDDSDDEDDSDEEDYTDWSTKDLKKECRTRGIKVTKGMGKAEMVKALEADDKE